LLRLSVTDVSADVVAMMRAPNHLPPNAALEQMTYSPEQLI
jgi:hypothetical protein